MKNDELYTQEDGGLKRFKAVNHVEECRRHGKCLAEALRSASVLPWPDENGRFYAVRTIEDWWYIYKRGGFQSLCDSPRSDAGLSRVIDEETSKWLLQQIRLHPDIQVSTLYDAWLKQGKALPSLRSIYRHLKQHGLDKRGIRAGGLVSGPTKAFEASHTNELWMCDFSPGPVIRLENDAVLRTDLCIIIDDYSRVIPYAAYCLAEDTENFAEVLKQAVMRRGVPLKLYTDNGGPFISKYLRIVCASLSIKLIHAKPYHAWSKGKVERVIRTIQRSYEDGLKIQGQQVHSLEELNAGLSHWIQAGYHQRVHSSTETTPEARYSSNLAVIRQLDLSEDQVERLFYMREKRTVRKDGTIRLNNRLYEVDLSLRALSIEVRFNPFTYKRVEVWQAGHLVCLATLLNKTINGETGGVNNNEK